MKHGMSLFTYESVMFILKFKVYSVFDSRPPAHNKMHIYRLEYKHICTYINNCYLTESEQKIKNKQFYI